MDKPVHLVLFTLEYYMEQEIHTETEHTANVDTE